MSHFPAPGRRQRVNLPVRSLQYILLLAAVLALSACLGPSESDTQRRADANTPAGKAGKVAHELAVKTEKAAAAAGREVNKAAHQAHEGWQEADREDKAKKH